MAEDFNLLSEFLEKKEIILTDEQKQMFRVYFETLVEVNKSFNLTAITDFEGVQEKHFLDSVASVSFLNYSDYDNLIDIGTGAGFPGLPLKILFPHLKVVLLDSLNKRVNFLNMLIENLGLKDVYAVHGRAEELARSERYREKFDICVSRAVSRLASLSELCIPFVKTGGVFVPYKSKECLDEVDEAEKAIGLFGGKLEKCEEMTLGTEKLVRVFPVIRKVKATPAVYPRKNGVPQKKPILKK